ncbi:MAG: hypothetical protein J7L47_03085 [Candidatus Odinarchaeota archaeon]|nr:hypothetical protein [Candidatus Odinarchaeota archaeon]
MDIANVTVIENETLILVGSILIRDGGALTLKNSKIYISSNYDGEHKIEVFSGGKLVLINSTITAYDSAFNYYIKIDSSATFYMENRRYGESRRN